MYAHVRSRAKDRPQAIAIAVFKSARELSSSYNQLPSRVLDEAVEVLRRPEFTGDKGEIAIAHAPAGKLRVIVLGLGEKDKLTSDAVRQAAARLLRSCWSAKIESVSLHLQPAIEGLLTDESAGQAAAEGLALANFEFNRFKGTAKDNKKNNKPLDLAVQIDPNLKTAFDRGLKLAESVNLARELASTPPNVANPGYLVNFCRKMARQTGLKISVIDARKARELGMGGLTAVGAAGSTPPALICLEHRPARAVNSGAPLLLVGKAVTFDTGGYSIKPADSMDRMKYDKCGGMAVIGAMHAAAQLKLPVHVVGLIPTAENMVASNAYRPGDILKMFNGVTVEVTNTDAEGRLILADALAWGCKQYKPSAIVDLATLTGGVVVALGAYCAGCFCNDTAFRSQLFAAGDFAGERLWHLPLWEEHRQQIKGTHGDIVNSAGREAHPIQGAAFLSYFVKNEKDSSELPWAHLDIAGVADLKNDGPVMPKGATGFGVRLLVRAMETWPK